MYSDSSDILWSLPYNYSNKVSYQNDFEYRACLRKLFCMTYPEDLDPDIDEVSRDELDFDQYACDKSLEYVYIKTINRPVFQKLYDAGAAAMISTDRSIGLSVLFSYDYMGLFHNCLMDFFTSPETFDENSPSFVSLHKKLT